MTAAVLSPAGGADGSRRAGCMLGRPRRAPLPPRSWRHRGCRLQGGAGRAPRRAPPGARPSAPRSRVSGTSQSRDAARASRGRCSTAGHSSLTRVSGRPPFIPPRLPAVLRSHPQHSGAAGSAEAQQGTCLTRERCCPQAAGWLAAAAPCTGEGPWGREWLARGGRGKVTGKRGAPAGPSDPYPR